MTCPKCGEEHAPTKCQGHVIKDPDTREPIPPRQCLKDPVKGSTVCRSHGAGRGTPARAAAEERQAVSQAQAEVDKLWVGLADAAPVTDPVSSLQQLAGALGAMVEKLGNKVSELKTLEAGDSLSQLRGTFLAFEKIEMRYQAALETMNRLGIAQQQLQLERDKARMVGVAVTDGLDAIDASPEQREVFSRAFLSRLRLDEAVAS